MGKISKLNLVILGLTLWLIGFSSLQAVQESNTSTVNKSITQIIPALNKFNFLRNAKVEKITKYADKTTYKATLYRQHLLVTTYKNSRHEIRLDSPTLRLKSIFPSIKNIPFLNKLAFDSVLIKSDYIEAKININKQQVTLVKRFKTQNNFLAIYFDKLNASSFIPMKEDNILNDMFLSDVMFIISNKSNKQIVTSKDLPKNLQKLANWKPNEKITLVKGVNLTANINLKEAKELKDALEYVDIKRDSLPIRGSLSIQSFKLISSGKKGKINNLSPGTKKSILQKLHISILIPTPSFPKLQNIIKIKGPAKISLGGFKKSRNSNTANTSTNTNKKHKRALQVSLHFLSKLNILGFKPTLPATIDLNALKNRQFNFTATNTKSWKAPFNIKDLNINRGNFNIDFNPKSSSKTSSISFSGIANFGKLKNLPISADFIRKRGKVELGYFKIAKKLSLADIPGGKNIPNVKKFALEDLQIFNTGISAKSLFGKTKVNVYLFEIKKGAGFNFAIEQNNFKFTELLKSARKIKLLNGISLPKATLIFSEKGFSAKQGDIPQPANALFDNIFKGSKININIKPGIEFIGSFSKKAFGIIGAGLQKIGVQDGSIITGGISGIFGGTPGFTFSISMEKQGKASGIPKKVISIPDVKIPDFFLTWQGLNIEAGAKVSLHIKAGKDRLNMYSKIGLDFSQEGVGIEILGAMKGKWKNPFGIKSLTLSHVKMTTGIKDTGEVNIGFSGDTKIGSVKFDLATNVNILLEDALPDGVAFSASVNKLGVSDVLAITQSVMGLKHKIDVKNLPYFELHRVLIAFATPGASDPQLGLVSDGLAFRGNFFFAGKELGEVKGSGGEKGVTFSGKIADINLDILKFQGNQVNFRISEKPDAKISSTIKLFGEPQSVLLDLNPPYFEFHITDKLGKFGKANLKVRVDGFDLSKGTFDKKADISLLGEFKSNILPWIDKELKEGLKELYASANKKLNDADKDLDKAQKKVDLINKKIRRVKKQDNRAKNRAENKINDAKRKVSHLKGDYHHAKHEEGHCGDKWTHWACKGYWRGVKDVDWGLYKGAEDILNAVKKVVAAAFSLDPRIAGLVAQKDIELTGLSLAKAVVEIDKKAVDFVLHDMEDIVNAAIKKPPFEIEQAILMGDLRGAIKHDTPLILDMKFNIDGKQHREYFAIKLKDLKFDAMSFALLPAMVLEDIIDNALKKVDPKIARWVKAHIASKLAVAQERVRKEVKAEEKKYKKVLASYENNTKSFKQAYEDQDKEKTDIMAKYQLTDLMSDSKEFRDKYLAVGHSDLCLGVASNGEDVLQKNCNDIQTEQWSTQSTKNGYVRLKAKGLCLKAKKINPSKNSGEFLTLAQCVDGDEKEQWKVESYDGFFDSIINRYSQKCLHFDKENANPKTANAIWTSCLGTDSQNFRVIEDAKRSTYHKVDKKIQAKNGVCLGVKKDFYAISRQINGRAHILDSNYELFQQQRLRNFNELVSVDCGSKNAQEFNYNEKVDGDIKLVDAINGWCIIPRNHKLALVPCDNGKDMLWRNDTQNERAFEMYNKKSNECLTLSKNNEGLAIMKRCERSPEQMIDFKQR